MTKFITYKKQIILFNFAEREKMKLSRNKILAILIIALLSITAFFTVSMFTISTSRGATQAAINTSILNGLLYLNSTQASNGEWGAGWYPVASTAMAVLAFENGGHYGWNASDPFSSTVQNGLNWLISQGQNITLSEQTAGNPDTSGTGIGIEWMGDGYPTYETSMALLAIIGSDAKTNVTLPGPLGVRTYQAIAKDTVDYLCFSQVNPVLNSTGQNTNLEAGGWTYGTDNDNSYSAYSDQSNTGWPVFALAGAELWGIYPPQWVLNELSVWIHTDQNLVASPTTSTLYGSFGYYAYNGKVDDILGQVSETAVGIEELTLEGALSTNSSIVAAEGNLNQMWTYNGGGWDVNMGNLYAMYNVMRACRDAVPPIQYISYFNGTNGVEWYNGTGQYADQILAAQSAGGYWTNGGWVSWAGSGDYSPELSTALACLILEPYVVNIATLFTLTVTAQDSQTLNPISGASVTASGPKTLTGTTAGNGKIVFSNVQAGNYAITVTAGGYSSSATVSVSVTSNTNYAVNLVSIAPETTPTPIPGLHVVIKSPSGNSVTIGAGNSITLTAYVSGGTSPYCYQWVLYQSPSSSLNSYISGAVLSTLHVSQTTPGTYYYFVIIFDANGNVAASNKITLTVTSSSATSTPTSTSPTTMPTTTPVVTPAPTATTFVLSIVDWFIIIVIIILLLLFFFILVWYRRRRNLTVTVQNSRTLSPISGANVSASGPKSLSGTTGSNGQIVFSNVQAGNYEIRASAAGYNPSMPASVSVTNKTSYVIKLNSTASQTQET